MDIQSYTKESYTTPSELSETVEKVEFPEGGLSGWSTVAGASVSALSE
jgi:hypothetical protein